MGQGGDVRNIHVGQQTDPFLTQSPFNRALSNMNCIMRSFMTSVPRQILERHAMWHACKELTNAYLFLTGNLNKTDRLEKLHVIESVTLKIDLKKSNGMAWAGSV